MLQKADRAYLEDMALEAAPAKLYYELKDSMPETPDIELIKIINRHSRHTTISATGNIYAKI